MNSPARFRRNPEWWLALGCTVLACVLQVRWVLHAGGLWRDEANSVGLGQLPTWSEFYHNLQFGSFPLLWLSLIRVLAQWGLASDAVLRTLGLGVGLANVAILWRNSRRFGTGVPLVALALLSVNATIICWGNSNGAFGLGLLFSMNLFWMVWELAQAPSARNIVLTLGVALLAVHTVFYNAVILFALGAGAAVVAFARWDWKPVAALGGIGIIAALSLGIYLPTFAGARSWNVLLRAPEYDFTRYWHMLAGAFSGKLGLVPALLWMAALLAAIVLGTGSMLAQIASRKSAEGAERRFSRDQQLRLYGLTTMVAGFFAYFGFLVFLSYSTNLWYYIALMGLLAQGADLLLAPAGNAEPQLGHRMEQSKLSELELAVPGEANAGCEIPPSPWSKAARFTRVLLGIATVLVVFPLVWTETGERYTNLDLIAAKLESTASKKDLVIVSPWACGISFQRYFHGPTPWITLPPVPTPRFHRFDLFKAMMTQPEPAAAILPVLEKIQSTLSSGGKVWMVGDLHFLRKGAKPFLLGPAPTPEFGWDNGLYHLMWAEQVAYFFQLYALTVHQVNVPEPGPVRELEKLPLAVFEGWRGKHPQSSAAGNSKAPSP